MPVYVFHIVTGILALVFGYTALFAGKGGRVHRRSGLLFVYAMFAVATGGFIMAVTRDVAPAVNVPAAVLTAYLVITGLTTVRPRFAGSSWLDPALLAVALGVGLSSAVFTLEAFANGGTRQGMPAFPFVMFSVVALIAAGGDMRLLRAGPLTGASRLARHLWRMSFALFIAALSFFIGQAQVFPKPVRIPGLLALPVVAVLVAMFYWLWRVRFRRSFRGIAPVSPPRAA